jgi:hypothetical protein
MPSIDRNEAIPNNKKTGGRDRLFIERDSFQ